MNQPFDNPVTLKRIAATWWPLAASWLLMSAESPAMSIVVARLANPEVNLAAFNITFSLALIVESPIIMLLSASTAFSKDWESYKKIRRFMMTLGAILTGLHILFAFTPLYYLVVNNILGVPAEIVEPARIGLMIMVPWSWAIAFRRFNQGALIRFGRSQTVGIGTIIRLSANAIILCAGFFIKTVPGIVVAASAVIAGVLSEAAYAGLAVRPVLRDYIKRAPAVTPSLTLKTFLAFYIPLVMTSLLSLIANPITSAALSRMPLSVESLAAWQVVSSLIFVFRSSGLAFNEVVVALMDETHSFHNLRKFTHILWITTTLLLLIITATPLANLWFGQIIGLSPDLAHLSSTSIWLTLPLPAMAVFQSWFQGSMMHGRKTRGITESVVIYLVINTVILYLGVAWGQMNGLYVGLVAMAASTILQTGWLWYRSLPVIKNVQQRDQQPILDEEIVCIETGTGS